MGHCATIEEVLFAVKTFDEKMVALKGLSRVRANVGMGGRGQDHGGSLMVLEALFLCSICPSPAHLFTFFFYLFSGLLLWRAIAGLGGWGHV
ncbi:hypothetical protein U1Q18_039220 [Sarracenia purpurea var. burkii]